MCEGNLGCGWCDLRLVAYRGSFLSYNCDLVSYKLCLLSYSGDLVTYSAFFLTSRLFRRLSSKETGICNGKQSAASADCPVGGGGRPILAKSGLTRLGGGYAVV